MNGKFMKLVTALTSLTLLTLTCACQPAGYYDSNGEYHTYGRSDTYRHDKAIADAPSDETGTYYAESSTASPTTTVIYDRAGYYDRNGYYISPNRGPRGVPADFLPPRGMCRMWFSDRRLDDQPPVESCRGIQDRVPDDAYVIYGGRS